MNYSDIAQYLQICLYCVYIFTIFCLHRNVLENSIVHRVFLDYFSYAETDKTRSEVIEGLRDTVVHMVHTREGAKVAMHCIWHGTAKVMM